LGMEYLGRTDLVQVPPKEVGELPEPPSGLAVDAGVQLGLGEDVPMAPISRPVTIPVANGHTDNGHGTTIPVTKVATKTPRITSSNTQTASVNAALSDMMGDAPLCDVCGHITVRNGSCYRCLNCGNSMGCS
jgi:ribonucleoside-diphosphate reductase alpha chain